MEITEFIKNPIRNNQLLDDEKINTDSFICLVINKNTLQTKYKTNDQYKENNYKTNIFIAAFTIALARLKLQEAFEILGEQVLYCDTDSII